MPLPRSTRLLYPSASIASATSPAAASGIAVPWTAERWPRVEAQQVVTEEGAVHLDRPFFVACLVRRERPLERLLC
jgi:hypothetical protein